MTLRVASLNLMYFFRLCLAVIASDHLSLVWRKAPSDLVYNCNCFYDKVPVVLAAVMLFVTFCSQRSFSLVCGGRQMPAALAPGCMIPFGRKRWASPCTPLISRLGPLQLFYSLKIWSRPKTYQMTAEASNDGFLDNIFSQVSPAWNWPCSRALFPEAF